MSQLTPLLPSNDLCSFSTSQEDHSFFGNQQQRYPDVEIVCIEAGAGNFVTGKNRVPFRTGDVIIIGSNLPHQFSLSSEYAAGSGTPARASIIRFLPDFWGDTFLNLNENAYIRILLKKAKQGIMLNGAVRNSIRNLVEQIMQKSGTGKIILLLEILHKISVCRDLEFLSSHMELTDKDELNRMENIYRYSRRNFNRKINLEEIAAVAYVSPNSFCRFFKSRARKTYSRFLIELRVKHACNLLIESRLCTKKICFESGFNNPSNFHKCFKEITGKSPLEYQKEFKSAALFG